MPDSCTSDTSASHVFLSFPLLCFFLFPLLLLSCRPLPFPLTLSSTLSFISLFTCSPLPSLLHPLTTCTCLLYPFSPPHCSPSLRPSLTSLKKPISSSLTSSLITSSPLALYHLLPVILPGTSIHPFLSPFPPSTYITVPSRTSCSFYAIARCPNHPTSPSTSVWVEGAHERPHSFTHPPLLPPFTQAPSLSPSLLAVPASFHHLVCHHLRTSVLFWS